MHGDSSVHCHHVEHTIRSDWSIHCHYVEHTMIGLYHVVKRRNLKILDIQIHQRIVLGYL